MTPKKDLHISAKAFGLVGLYFEGNRHVRFAFEIPRCSGQFMLSDLQKRLLCFDRFSSHQNCSFGLRIFIAFVRLEGRKEMSQVVQSENCGQRGSLIWTEVEVVNDLILTVCEVDIIHCHCLHLMFFTYGLTSIKYGCLMSMRLLEDMEFC